MFVFAFVRKITDFNPDFTVSYLNGEGLQIVTFDVEAPSCLKFETPTMPIAS